MQHSCLLVMKEIIILISTSFISAIIVWISEMSSIVLWFRKICDIEEALILVHIYSLLFLWLGLRCYTHPVCSDIFANFGDWVIHVAFLLFLLVLFIQSRWSFILLHRIVFKSWAWKCRIVICLLCETWSCYLSKVFNLFTGSTGRWPTFWQGVLEWFCVLLECIFGDFIICKHTEAHFRSILRLEAIIFRPRKWQASFAWADLTEYFLTVIYFIRAV